MMNKLKIFFILSGYQLTWIASVFSEIKFNQPLIGIFVCFIFIFFYFIFTKNKNKFLRIVLLISLPGYIFDTLMVYFNIYTFNTSFIFGVLPIWMLTLWLSFAVLFDEILVFLKNYKILGVILSTTLGPMTYYLGEPLGIIYINNIILFFISMIIFWSLLILYYIEYVIPKFHVS